MRDLDRLDLPALPAVPLTTRLYSSTALHRCVPRQVAFGLARALNDVRWHGSHGYREWCRRSMHYLLGLSPRADEVDAIAKEWGYYRIKRSELLWRPWLLARLPVDGIERLRAARAQKRGVLLSFIHHGWYFGMFPSLRHAAGVTLHIPVAPYFFDPLPPNYSGRRARQQMLVAAAGGPVFSAAGSRRYINDLLERGEVVVLGFDVPGRARTNFLGRTVYAASGLAQTAKSTGAVIVPVTMWAHGDLARITVEEPVLPEEFGSVEDLHAAVVARHEPAVLAWPEAMEWPLQRWGDQPQGNPAG